MSKKKQYNHENKEMTHDDYRPYWKRVRIHHTWGFWIFLILMFGAIIYYIMSIDFACAPRQQLKQSSENSVRLHNNKAY